jgi:hypothetical protein
MELDRPRAGSFVATSGEVTCCCVHVYTTTKLKLVCFCPLPPLCLSLSPHALDCSRLNLWSRVVAQMYEVCFPTARGEKVTVTRGTEEYQNLHKLVRAHRL